MELLYTIGVIVFLIITISGGIYLAGRISIKDLSERKVTYIVRYDEFEHTIQQLKDDYNKKIQEILNKFDK